MAFTYHATDPRFKGKNPDGISATLYQSLALIQLCPAYLSWAEKNSKYLVETEYVERVKKLRSCRSLVAQVVRGDTQIDCVAYALSHTILHEVPAPTVFRRILNFDS